MTGAKEEEKVRIPFEEMMDGEIWEIEEDDLEDAWIRPTAIVVRDGSMPEAIGDPDRWESPDRNVTYDVHEAKEGTFWALEGGWLVIAQMLNGLAHALGGTGKPVMHVDSSDLKIKSDDRPRGYTFQALEVKHETL